MKKPLKTFELYIQFDSIDMRISARNKREAKKKAVEKLKAMPAFRVMDKQNYFINEVHK